MDQQVSPFAEHDFQELVSEPHAINVSPNDVRPIDFCGEFLLVKKLFHLKKPFHPSLPPHAQKLFQA